MVGVFDKTLRLQMGRSHGSQAAAEEDSRKMEKRTCCFKPQPFRFALHCPKEPHPAWAGGPVGLAIPSLRVKRRGL